ncbi:MAG TPA: PqiA/YebS family transporter subunit [Rhodopila sp.]|nr:PqiA/YebS family transporter subunit [Rhodopila sp.]
MVGAASRPADLPLSPARADTVTQPRLRACLGCGQFQVLPAMAPGHVARCNRCNAELRRVRRDPLGRGLALNLTALALLAIVCTTTLLTVSTFGMYRSATVFSGPVGFGKHQVWILAASVAFMSILAPLLRLILVSYVLLGLRRLPRPPLHLRDAFRWAERIRPWSMVEVYLLGLFVAITEFPGLVHVDVGIGVYALVALMLTMIAADAVLDRQAVWDEMERRGLVGQPVDHAGATTGASLATALTCETCQLVCFPSTGEETVCPRCGSTVEARKRNSLSRTWALVITSFVLYVPANVLPVLAFMELGTGEPHTIIGGARELLNAGMWPLALLVFLASIGVPCLKLASLLLLLVTTHAGSSWQLRQRTVLYRLVSTIGRWSMIDIFMASVLVALVQFGSVVTINPGTGAVAFAGVVIMTMFAADCFDPRLMWDAALRRDRADSI